MIILKIYCGYRWDNVTTIFDKEDLIQSLDLFNLTVNNAIYFCLIGIGTLIAALISVASFVWTMERQIRMIRRKFFQSIMQQEIGWFDTHKIGELVTGFYE